ncbi:unnamed protein product [Cladocopium goreaui]|uniref:Uncharacterized protein HI_0568 n=1 Tax=Cladocopium goreaui TaxID=2562237 RepID=A0A9P1G3V2_9DINO|nr:unnamed protein product [Cladocopium goreaui]
MIAPKEVDSASRSAANGSQGPTFSKVQAPSELDLKAMLKAALFGGPSATVRDRSATFEHAKYAKHLSSFSLCMIFGSLKARKSSERRCVSESVSCGASGTTTIPRSHFKPSRLLWDGKPSPRREGFGIMTPKRKAARRGARSKAKSKPQKNSQADGEATGAFILNEAQRLRMDPQHVAQGVQLLEEDMAVPFIATYRKEVTGQMTTEQLTELDRRLRTHRIVEEKRWLLALEWRQNGALTSELEESLRLCDSLQDLEDLHASAQRQLALSRAWIRIHWMHWIHRIHLPPTRIDSLRRTSLNMEVDKPPQMTIWRPHARPLHGLDVWISQRPRLKSGRAKM